MTACADDRTPLSDEFAKSNFLDALAFVSD
jgi:hypothetical protein